MYTPSLVKIPGGGLKIPPKLVELTWNDSMITLLLISHDFSLLVYAWSIKVANNRQKVDLVCKLCLSLLKNLKIFFSDLISAFRSFFFLFFFFIFFEQRSISQKLYLSWWRYNYFIGNEKFIMLILYILFSLENSISLCIMKCVKISTILKFVDKHWNIKITLKYVIKRIFYKYDTLIMIIMHLVP